MSGVPALATLPMFMMIQLMKFFLQTAYGDLANFYGGGLSGSPFQGVCQGNGAGPTIWLAMSMCIVQMVHTHSHPTTITSAISCQQMTLIGFLYVDNTDLIYMALDTTTTSQEVVNHLQLHLSIWQHGLHASGGALAPAKCSWSMLDYYWHWCLWRISLDKPSDLLVANESGPASPITFNPPTDATVVIGLAQSLTGSMAVQYKILEDKIPQWIVALPRGKLPHGLSWRGFHSMLWPSLRYPLAATMFSPPQGTMLTHQFITGLLPFLRCAKNFPMALCHGPPTYFGLHLPHIYWEQGAMAISTFLSSFQTSSSMGSLLLANFEQVQLEVGVGTPFLELDFETYDPLLTPCWLCSLWEFLSYANISLCSLVLVPGLPPQRVGDNFLMELALSDPQWSRQDLLTINHCRLALHCLTMANVAMGDGHYLWTNSSPPLALPSTYLWP